MGYPFFDFFEPYNAARANNTEVSSSPLISQEKIVSVINTVKRFHILVDVIGIGDSFSMSANVVHIFKDCCRVSVCSVCTNTVAANYV